MDNDFDLDDTNFKEKINSEDDKENTTNIKGYLKALLASTVTFSDSETDF